MPDMTVPIMPKRKRKRGETEEPEEGMMVQPTTQDLTKPEQAPQPAGPARMAPVERLPMEEFQEMQEMPMIPLEQRPNIEYEPKSRKKKGRTLYA